ncbi:MAG: Ig-like domain-containing protein [Clostridiales bacterium]|nr:Ig-like domain-containing protein [Clostridiales bacterium]
MKKRNAILSFLTALIIAVFSASLSACADRAEVPTVSEPPPVFSLDKTHIELTVDGNLEMLTLSVANVDDVIEWKSANPAVATVTVNQTAANRATVRAVSKGQTVISAVAGEYIAVCTVKVNPPITLELLTPTLSLLSGTTGRIEVETDAEALTYTSDNRGVATVNDNGLVSAIAGGTARITVAVAGGGKSVVCTVTVIEPYVRLDTDEVFLMLQEGYDTYRLTAESNGDIEWNSNNKEVATVEDGLITARSVGTAKITASYASATAECTVKVKSEILTVALSETAHTLQPGDTFTLIATISPEQEGDDANVTWSVVSGENLVSVDSDGNVTANDNKMYGNAVVRATSVKDPDYYADCVVTVPDPYGDWLVISDMASFEAAFKSGNENKNMYLTSDIDLDGATVSSSLGTYNGTIEGRGYTISNFTTGKLFGSVGEKGVIKQLGISCTAKVGSNEGLFGLEMKGKVENCRLEISIESPGNERSVFGRNGGATTAVSNTVLLLRNLSSSNNTSAGFVQGGAGTWKSVYYAVYEGKFTANGPTLKTDAELRSADLYADFDSDIWYIVDGELPQLASEYRPGMLKIKLDRESTELFVGEEQKLTATVTPASLSDDDRAVTWVSGDESVFTVSGGVIRAVKAGTATLTVRSVLEPDKTATCTVTVKAIEISIDTAVTEMRSGTQKQLTASVNRGGYTWESSNNSVATVSSSGLVEAVGTGTVTITVRSTLDPTVTDKVTIEVKDKVQISVNISDKALSLDRDDSAKLTATVVNSDMGVTWSSSNPAVASVDDFGNITTHGIDGTAVITATAVEDDGGGNHASASCTVTVQYVAVTVSAIGELELELQAGNSISLSELATTNKGSLTATVTSGDGVVKIESGAIKAVAEGTATVRISSSVSYEDHPSPYVDITLNVFMPAIEISLNATRYSTGLTSTTLSVLLSLMPDSPSAGDITWSSNNTAVIDGITSGVASGAYTGTFTPKAYGFATVTASYTLNGRAYTASCDIEVFNPNGAKPISTVDGLRSALSTPNGNYYLACDIDFGDTVYTTSFAGTVVSVTVDGRGYSLKNITTNFTANEIGFINMLDGLTTLKNISFVGFDIGGTLMYGGLIGSITGNAGIENCYFEGIISARRANESYVGTIGTIHPTPNRVENCVFSVGFGDGALDSVNANANPKVIAGRWFGGTMKAFVNSTAIGGAKVLIAPLNGQEKYGEALKTEDALKSASTYDDSWSGWVTADGELPRIRTGWDD